MRNPSLRLCWSFGGSVILSSGALVHAANPELFTLRTHEGGPSGGRLGSSVAPAGDLNHDGVMDYIIGSPGTGPDDTRGAVVRSGANGSTLFQFPGEDGKMLFGYSVAGAGDVNHDGFEDIIIGDPEMGTGCIPHGGALVYSGQDGSLIYFFTGDVDTTRFGHAVAGAGDVDGDGYADFMVGEPDRSTLILTNAGHVTVFSGYNGAVLFDAYGTQNSHLGDMVIPLGDVNGDGHPDIAVSAPAKRRVYVFDAFNQQTIRVLTGSTISGFGASIADAGDVNGDGRNDLAVGAPFDGAPSVTGKVYVYSGSDGSLLRTHRGLVPGDGTGSCIAAAGDINGDGTPDIFIGSPECSNGTGGDVGVAQVRNGATGQIILTRRGESEFTAFGAAAASVGDLNNDGYDDLIVGAPKAGNANRGEVYIYTGGPTQAGLSDSQCMAVSGIAPETVAAADLNGDGRADLVTLSPQTDQMSIRIAKPDGTYKAAKLHDVKREPRSVVIGDFDGDGDNDLAVAARKSNEILLFRNNGTGKMTQVAELKTSKKPVSIVAGDFNKDGSLDLAVANQVGDDVNIFISWHSQYPIPLQSRFKPAKKYSVGDGPVSVVMADVNGDTWPDLITASKGSNEISMRMNLQNGNFGPLSGISVDASPVNVIAADFDGDGYNDLASYSQATGNVTMLRNHQNGTFETSATLSVGQTVSALAVLDVDADLYLDLAVCDSASNSITILRNEQNNQFFPYLSKATAVEPRGLAVADLDGDGDLDLISADRASARVSLFFNTWF